MSDSRRKVYIDTLTHNGIPLVHVVCYLNRRKHQRYYAAQFDPAVEVASIRKWITGESNLELVEKDAKTMLHSHPVGHASHDTWHADCLECEYDADLADTPHPSEYYEQTAEETEMIQQGATMLRDALLLGRVTVERIQEQQKRDIETVRVREYWGDRNEQQQLITRGIKLRIAARKIILEESELSRCNQTT